MQGNFITGSNPFLLTKNLLYILQAEEYNLDRFWNWLKRHSGWTGLEKNKKLVWTGKVKALFFFTVFFWFLFFLVSLLVVWLLFKSFLIMLIALGVLIFFTKALVVLSLLLAVSILAPAVWLAKFFIQSQARRKIARQGNLKVIGISGSFGKTSVKEFLAAIVSTKFSVLKTPDNTNTLIGIAQVVVKKMRPEHEVLIVEIGAYVKGDTRAVAKLIKPSTGILTGVNEQHLERFGTLENVIATESELLEELPSGGVAVLNQDDRYYEATKAHVARDVRLLTFSLTHGRLGEAVIKSLEVTEGGSRFTIEDGGRVYRFETKLLGRHNVSNILASIAGARSLGMGFEDICRAVKNIEAPLHRLQPIWRESGIIILDDSYNVNPDGAQAALDVLSLFRGRRKIVLTHGFVELAGLEEKFTRDFGEKVARVADIVIAAGPKAKWIREGLEGAHFSKEHLIVTHDITDASERLRQILKPNDIVLIQTDLPDTYY